MKLLLKASVYLSLALFVFLVLSLWPLRSFLTPGFLLSKHLLIFTNEAEARPCGGFVTAVGTFQVFPPHITLKNSYALAEPLGPAEPPLTKVAEEKYFWDLGIDTDLALCSEKFKAAHEAFFPEELISNVLLIDFSTIESVLALFEEIELDGEIIRSQDIFAYLTRLVADVDRHDERSLQGRKRPLVTLTREIFGAVLAHPWRLPQITSIIKEKQESGLIFVSGYSPVFAPSTKDIAVVEWNLGGAKTSRSLKKTLKIVAREITPDQWGVILKFSAENLGGLDEPLSQDWKGVFQFQLPEYLGGEMITEELTLPPGDVWNKVLSFGDVRLPRGENGKRDISVFVPRGQKLFTDFSLSLLPQKTFKNASFQSHENIGELFEVFFAGSHTFTWEELPDHTPPFVTLHEFISPEQVASQTEFNADIPLWVEVHFNEKVVVSEGMNISLTDRDFENKTLTENPALKYIELLEDGRTIIMGFLQTAPQQNERYYLKIDGVKDLWGNKIEVQQRTLIDRLNRR